MAPCLIGCAMGRVAYICGDGSSSPGTTLNSTLARFASYFGTFVSLLAEGSYFLFFSICLNQLSTERKIFSFWEIL